ncbi:FG-GAP-like repeat-containing protein [Hymenobacter sp. ASUV-10]|uniref:FG-GAP-like repeat-containing protein n=1 Tax=Hymenobacter aranciens TaxID=3063996 RepID=A0ABT9BEG6_9BACT|nr:FG-GAP-like repeat-containing protein [Hymenobacter sp. ASUV-10]MDO7876666.1 FG-GAP-like repeat-containing protein [Hymenobacter sp. ASUV-10]
MPLPVPFSLPLAGGRNIFGTAAAVRGLLAGLLLSATAPARAQAPTVTSVTPPRNSTAVAVSSVVRPGFSQAITAASAATLRVYGNQLGGVRAGSLTGGGSTLLTFTPTRSFGSGELVSVSLPATLTNASGVGIRPQVYQFRTAASGTGRGFFIDSTVVGVTNSRDQVLADVDNDGDLDLLTTGGLFGAVTYRNDGTGRFSFYINSVVGSAPGGLAVGDFNQDGYLDIVAGDADNAAISICLNDGTGRFGVLGLGGQILPVGLRPVSVTVGDVDADGDLDVVTANRDGNSASVRLNNGAGYFLASVDVAVGTRPSAVALSDVDGDGDLDLLVSNEGSNSVTVRLNSGSGQFSGGSTVSVGAGPTELVVADINNDRLPDLLTANGSGGSWSIRRNIAAGVFSSTGTTVSLPTGSTPTGLAAADVDADGDLDVVIAQGTGGQVLTYLNNAAGTFTAQVGSVQLVTPGWPTASEAMGVTLGDVDGDGDLDLITANHLSNSVVLVRNGATPAMPTLAGFTPAAGVIGATVTITGSHLGTTLNVSFNGVPATSFTVVSATQLTAVVPAGATSGPVVVTTQGGSVTSATAFQVVPPLTVTAWQPARNAPTVNRTSAVQVTCSAPIEAASATATGGLAVFSALRQGRRPGTLTGGGTATLAFQPTQPFGVGEWVSVSTRANLRGTSGAVLNGQTMQFITATGGTGEGFFGPATTRSMPGVATMSQTITADLDGDDNLDLITSTATGLTVRPGQGTNGFGPGVSVSLAGGTGTLLVGDLDGDADLDVVAGARDPLNPYTYLFININGSLILTQTLTQVAPMALGDVDADGDLDLLARSAGYYYLKLCRNLGTGTLATPTDAGPTGLATTPSFALGDCNNDGKLDVVLLGNTFSQNRYLRILLGDGQGQFDSLGQGLLRLGAIQSLALGDFDNDGDLDIVIADPASSLTVVLNDGSGSLNSNGVSTSTVTIPPSGMSAASPPTTVSVADVDGDGDLDLLTGQSVAGKGGIAVLLNNGQGQFQPSPNTPYAVGALSTSPHLLLADFDGDLDLDALVSDATNGQDYLCWNSPRPRPLFTAFMPALAPVGRLILVAGRYFSQASEVRFNGTVAPSFQVVSDSLLRVTVPVGATTGLVDVTTPMGRGTSATAFVVTPTVTIVRQTPAAMAVNAPTGSSLSLTFSQPVTAAAADIRVFGDLRQGLRTGTLSGNGSPTLTFTPTQPFAPNEQVSVSLGSGIATPSGPLAGQVLPQGNSFRAAAPGPGTAANFGPPTRIGNSRQAPYAAPGDLDGDGDLDFVSLSSTELRTYENRGAAGMVLVQTLPFTHTPSAIQLADIDNDSDLDVISTYRDFITGGGFDGGMFSYTNDGNGRLTAASSLQQQLGGIGGVALADLDNDGDLDMVLPTNLRDSTNVRLNDGHGNFKNHARLLPNPGNSTFYLNTVVIGDIDGDGDLDIVAAEPYLAGIYTFLNDGAANFSPARVFRGGGSLTDLTLTDFDQDGDLDLLGYWDTTSFNAISLIYNDGTGDFGRTPLTNFTVAPETKLLKMGDVDGDGDLDILTTHNNWSSGLPIAMRWYLNTNGIISPANSLTFALQGWALATADFDGDGSLDLLASYNGDSQVTAGLFTILNRPAAPTLTAFSPATAVAGSTITLTGTNFGSTSSVLIGGVAATFVVVSATQLTVVVPALASTGTVQVITPGGSATAPGQLQLPGPTLAGFTPPAGAPGRLVTLQGTYLGGATQVQFNGVAASSFTVVSATEVQAVVPGNATTGRLTVITPSGLATSVDSFHVRPSTMVTSAQPGYNANQVPVGTNLQFNFSAALGATLPDGPRVFSALRQGRRTGTVTGAGTTTLRFDPTLDFAPGELINVSTPAPLFDQNSDPVRGQVQQFRTATGGTGRGFFVAHDSLMLPNNLPTLGTSLVADFDNDSYPDLLAVTGSGNSARLRRGTPTGWFDMAAAASRALEPRTVSEILAADLDGDGDLDVITKSKPSYSVYGQQRSAIGLNYNDGTGNFAQRDTLECRSWPGTLQVGDLNADGYLDFVGGWNNDSIAIGFTNGQGRVARLAFRPVPGSMKGVALGDLDNDGDLDLVGSDFTGGSRLYLNDGAANFSPGQQLAGPSQLITTLLADFDNDGLLDVVQLGTASFGAATGQLALWRNQRSSFTVIRSTLPVAPSTAVVGDVNADGLLDIVVLMASSQRLPNCLVLLNGGAAGFSQQLFRLAPGLDLSSLQLTDLDGDADLDLSAMASWPADILITARNEARLPTATAAPATGAPADVLYPNPARSAVTWRGQVTVGQPVTLQLLNSLGQVVSQQTLPAAAAPERQARLPVQGLAAGFYTVRVTNPGQVSRLLRLIVE